MACVSIGECDRDIKGHLKFCKISGDIAVKNESRLLLDIVFIAYGYVAMTNSQSLRGHSGLQCCGVAYFFLCGISVNESHRAVLR